MGIDNQGFYSVMYSFISRALAAQDLRGFLIGWFPSFIRIRNHTRELRVHWRVTAIRITAASLVLCAASIGCGVTLDACLERDIDSLTEQEASACYQLASAQVQSEQIEEQGDDKRREVQELLSRLPAPTPTPAPKPPTTAVGFLEFQYRLTQVFTNPAEVTWFGINNVSGVWRLVEHNLWSAKDSKGNSYGPYWIVFDSRMQISGQECWERVIGGYDRYLLPNRGGCKVGFVWYLEEPGSTITEVIYDGKRLPLEGLLGDLKSYSPVPFRAN